MSEKYRLMNEFPLEELESRVIKGDFTKEDYDEVKYMFIAPGVDVEGYVETQIIAEGFRWNGEGRLVPNYQNITSRISLSPEAQEALRQKKIETGKHPEEIMEEIIYEGLGLTKAEDS